MELYFLSIFYNNGREPQELAGEDCHTVKSIAGTVFYYADSVERVLVSDRKGREFLVLDKTHPENNKNVSSRLTELVPAYVVSIPYR